MNRVLSYILAFIMLISSAFAAFPVSAANAFNIDQVEAKYFDSKPHFDGFVSEAEWGSPVTLADQRDAATVYDQDPYPNFFITNGNGYDLSTMNMSYYLWLGWDEDYFYVAAKVSDPDGHSNLQSKSNLWNGDALQMRIDPEGANAVVWGEEFYPEDVPDHKPWSTSQVCDLIFGYTQNAGGYKEAWNNTVGVNRSMLPDNSYTQQMGRVDLAVGTAGSSYTTDTQNGITTYEIAIPWSYIDASFQQRAHYYYPWSIRLKKNPDGSVKSGPDGAIGYEYGMSAVVLNAVGDNWNALLTWGSGVATIQDFEYYRTCAGSNAVILSADKLSEDPSYDADYEKYNLGGMTPPNPVNVWDDFIDYDALIELPFDDASDVNYFGASSNAERVQLEDGNYVLKWDKATGQDLDDWFPESGYPEPTLNTYNYLSSEGVTAGGEFGPAFTFEFDVMVTGTEEWEEGYAPFIGNWFGGSSIDYYCGYFFDEGKFKITNFRDPSEVFAECSAELTLNEWHHWVFQYNNADNTLCFYVDPLMGPDGFVHKYAYPMFRFQNKYFDYGTVEEAVMIFRRLNAQIMIDNVRFYNAVDFSSRATIEPKNGDVNCDGKINTKDVLLLRKYIGSLANDGDIYNTAADVNQDNNINTKDVLMLRKYIGGLIDELPAILIKLPIFEVEPLN